MKTTKIGIIGCGNICAQYFQWLAIFPTVKIEACADLDLSRAQAKATEHGIRALTVEQLLADLEIEIVVNLTIPKAHAEVNQAILAAGKHAYTEKPFALDLEEGLHVIDVAKKAGLRVGCAPDTFLGGGLQTCRKLIDEGAIGKVIAATGNYRTHGPERWHPDPSFVYHKGGGPMLDMGPYYLTALVNFLGPIRRVSGSARASFPERIIGSGTKKDARIQVEVPTHYSGVFDFANGAIAVINVSFDIWIQHQPFLEVYGTEGTLNVPDPNFFGGTVRLLRGGEKDWEEIPLTHSPDVGRGFGVADMAQAIATNRPHRVSGDLALHVLEAMLAVERASESNSYYLLKTSCERPAALPVGLKPGDIDP